MRPTILAFAGGIGSGKSTLSSEVANTLGWKRLSFGTYIRNIAIQNDMGQSRETLQNLGETMIHKLGWEKFCKDFLEKGNWDSKLPLIIDGVRHIEILDALKKITSPNDVLLVFISLTFNERFSRLIKRENIENINLHEFNSHSTELQIYSTLSEEADLILDGHNSIKNLTKEIISWLHQVFEV